MAARAPTAFDLTIDESLMRPRKPILDATPDAVLDNQERLVDMPRVVLLDMFPMTNGASTAFGANPVAGPYYFRGRDAMGTGTITDARVYVLSRSDASGAGTDTFEIRVTIGGVDYDLSVASGDTTWTWRLVSSSVTLLSDETEEEMLVQARLPTGVGTRVLMNGVFLTTV